MFNSLRENSPFYILDKGGKPSVKIGQVVRVDTPPMFNQFNAISVDVVVKVGEEMIDFKQLPSNQTIANKNGVIVSDSREALLQEWDAFVRISQQVLDSMPYHKEVIDANPDILKILNPQFAKEREQEEKISSLEGKINGIEGTLSNMYSMLGNLTKSLESEKPKKSKSYEDD